MEKHGKLELIKHRPNEAQSVGEMLICM